MRLAIHRAASHELFQRRILRSGGAVIAGEVDHAGLVRVQALITIIEGQSEQSVGVRFAVLIGIAGSVVDGISARHGGLGGLAGGFTEGLETRREISGAILIGGELLLEKAKGLDGASFSGWARTRESQREREPDDGPDAGDNDQECDGDFQRAGRLARFFGKSRLGLDLLRAAIGTDGARGVNGLLTILAEVHAVGRG